MLDVGSPVAGMLEIATPPAWRGVELDPDLGIVDGGIFRLDQLGGGDDVGGAYPQADFGDVRNGFPAASQRQHR
jgi:hypothetical protein